MASIVSDSVSSPNQISDDGLFCVLPDEILHQILFVLTLKQRAIASVVSRKWHHMISSFGDRKIVQCFRTVLTKLGADKSSIIEFYSFDDVLLYSNMLQRFLESRLLTVLHIGRGCKIEEKDFGDIKELSSLKEIYFGYVRISSNTFAKFISKCPSIVNLTLVYPHCSTESLSISVPDLKQLTMVHIKDEFAEIGSVEIKARNLQECHLFLDFPVPIKLDLCACTKLQVLKVRCDCVPIRFLKNIDSVFPCLKSLFLDRLDWLNTKIKLCIPQLEDLTLRDIKDWDEPIVVAPNLRSFKLITYGRGISRSCPVVGSRLMEVEIAPYIVRPLLLLRTHAENYVGENLTFSLKTLATESQEFYSSYCGSNIQPLCIKRINLNILFEEETRNESFIDEMFSYFHPQTLQVKVDLDALQCDFIQVLLNQLKLGEKERNKYYFLKDFKILESTKRQGSHKISLELLWFE